MDESGIVYSSSEETAKRWGISDRRVRILCENGQISGAVRNGKLWKIPSCAEKPRDGRTMRSLGIPVSMRGIIAEIDSLKEQLAAKRPLTDGEREQLRNAFLVDYTYSSNAIEGNTLTLGETAMVLAGMTIGEKPLRDHLEAIGHRDAFCFLEESVKSGDAISEAFSPHTTKTATCCHCLKYSPNGNANGCRTISPQLDDTMKTQETIIAEIESDIHMTVKRRNYAYAGEHAGWLDRAAKDCSRSKTTQFVSSCS